MNSSTVPKRVTTASVSARISKLAPQSNHTHSNNPRKDDRTP